MHSPFSWHLYMHCQHAHLRIMQLSCLRQHVHHCSSCTLVCSSKQRCVQVEDSIVTQGDSIFDALEDLHICTARFKASRLRDPSRPTTAMLLRTWLLPHPVQLLQDPAYWGCFSWGAQSSQLGQNLQTP